MKKYKRILLTGASGRLGKAILSEGVYENFLIPGMDIFDVTKFSSIKLYFKNHKFDAVIHCAALARMSECEKNPSSAIKTNIVGTGNLVMAVMDRDGKLSTNTRFIHISTDGVYSGTRGNYSETSEAIPYNRYGWTKLGAECAVNLLKNFCIIRTSFFDPSNIKFDDSATDLYSSKLTVDHLSRAILTMLESEFIGTINIGGRRQSDYKKYKTFKPLLRPCKGADISKSINFKIAKDASLNSGRWKKIEEKSKVSHG